ncbi:hypothetical protein HHI36_021715 [Cryptolaemus montrouzieri]|uniref:Uncharacterized protein n=1 Tax=Cryptolaemus montrouzieri TaxID=559131 RepID=A0ABD2MYZ0_9CUCU
MNSSKIETTKPSEAIEPEDKSLVNQFIAERNIWERNNYSETNIENELGNHLYKTDFPKIKSEQPEDESNSFMNNTFDGEAKILCSVISTLDFHV